MQRHLKALIALFAIALVVTSVGCTNSDPVLSSGSVLFSINLVNNTTRYELGIAQVFALELQPADTSAQVVLDGDPILPIATNELPFIDFNNDLGGGFSTEADLILAPGFYTLSRLQFGTGQFSDFDGAGDGLTCASQNFYSTPVFGAEDFVTFEVRGGSQAISLDFDVAAFMAAVEANADPNLNCIPSADALEAALPTFVIVG